ncbi:MAG: thioredoxin-disulfide reductase [Candidatus Omnitrophica bacterium]|nr:thioredoxin-disulfide reductase [Candidatus Omnitrophota bacterium]
MVRYDVIIIGAGPAGLSAALYAGRAGFNTLVLERMVLGGRVILTEKIENYPGIDKGILSTDLIKNMEVQIRQFDNVDILFEDVKAVDFNLKKVFTEKNYYEAEGFIIAVGAKEKRLNVKGEKEFLGKGVSYCAICDGPLYKNKEVVVVGGGDSAVEEALYLSRFCSKVRLIHRRDKFRASRILQERLQKTSNVEQILNSIILEIKGDKQVKEVLIKDVISEDLQSIQCSGVFIYVGIEPNTDFLKGLINMDEYGFILTDENMATSCEAVFACGDCRRKSLYQIITACAEGAIALNSLQGYLLKK